MIVGLWWGYNIGMAAQCIYFVVFVARLDWQLETDKVRLLVVLFMVFNW